MGKIKINEAGCKGCYLCVTSCPNGLIKISDKLNSKGVKGVFFSGGKCTACSMCAIICPECIIEVYRSVTRNP
jgi:2-oxoglutarate ferredoxin oxidoreductase subunit delta